MSKARMEEILPVEQDGQTVWRTFEGQWLAGLDIDGAPRVGLSGVS